MFLSPKLVRQAVNDKYETVLREVRNARAARNAQPAARR